MHACVMGACMYRMHARMRACVPACADACAQTTLAAASSSNVAQVEQLVDSTCRACCPLFTQTFKIPQPQDAWAVKEKLSPTSYMALFGVFDGHGAEGKAVSHHVTAQLPRMVARSPLCKVRVRECVCESACAWGGKSVPCLLRTQ